ncbi:MAG: hypothetical protein GY947_22665 [Rhodobacteraceae bacterium]|nr:hypothetical protein [Paracoccaceae bacterium]
MRKLVCPLAMFLATASSLNAGEADSFRVAGSTLYYDTETTGDDNEISDDHVDVMRKLLQTNDTIDTLSLNSGGGSVWAADEMSRIAVDFELKTVVAGKCSSSCVMIFLGGDDRKMERGSKIGFHSRDWSPTAIENYYEKWKEDERWETPFEFASWVYTDTRAEVYDDLSFLLSRGIDPLFAIKMLTPRNEMWYPTRAELLAVGILRD